MTTSRHDDQPSLSPSTARLARTLLDLASATTSSQPTQQVAAGAMSEHDLTELVLLCQAAFTKPVAVSVIMGPPRDPALIATGSKLAQNVDGAQVTAGEGPTHDCWEQGLVVHTSELPADGRWPRLGAHLDDVPVCSVISAPIARQAERTGALNIYSVYDDLVDAATVEVAELLAESLAGLLHDAQVKTQLEAANLQLETALRSRATIDQAKGILMARHRCDAEKAFAMLAEASSSANVKLRVLAERLVRETAEGTHQDGRVG